MIVTGRENLRGFVAGGQWQRVLLCFFLLLALPRPLDAHDIPTTVLVRLFVKPDAQTLRILVRVPLEAMRDTPFPVRDGDRYLDIAGAEKLLSTAATTWIASALLLYEGDSPLRNGEITRTRLSLPSSRAFAAYDDAVRHFADPPLDPRIDLPWKQALFDVEIDFPITSASSRFSIEPALGRLGVRTTTVLRFLPAVGPERAYEYIGDPGLVRLDPRWSQAAWAFVRLGFSHILDGIDHLLFILCLVIPFRRLKPLISIVTAFTVAHSITLIASTMGMAPGGLWFPPLIEVLIALSILYMALDNIMIASAGGHQGRDSLALRRVNRRWMIAFAFGLVHGFGFSFALRDSLQFAGTHLATSLLSFNVGVEFGQIAVLLVAIPALNILFSRVATERIGTVILSAFVAHTAWHWLTERWVTFRRYQLASAGTGLSLGLAGVAAVLGIGAWFLKRGDKSGVGSGPTSARTPSDPE